MGWSRRPQSHCHPETDPLPNNRPRDHHHTRPRKTQIINTPAQATPKNKKNSDQVQKKCKTVLFRFNLHWWLNLYRFSASVYVLHGVNDQMVHLNVTHHYTRDPRQVKVSSPGVRFHNSAIPWGWVLMFGPRNVTGFIICLSRHAFGCLEVRFTFNVNWIVCWIYRGSNLLTHGWWGFIVLIISRTAN